MSEIHAVMSLGTWLAQLSLLPVSAWLMKRRLMTTMLTLEIISEMKQQRGVSMKKYSTIHVGLIILALLFMSWITSGCWAQWRPRLLRKTAWNSPFEIMVRPACWRLRRLARLSVNAADSELRRGCNPYRAVCFVRRRESERKVFLLRPARRSCYSTLSTA